MHVWYRSLSCLESFVMRKWQTALNTTGLLHMSIVFERKQREDMAMILHHRPTPGNEPNHLRTGSSLFIHSSGGNMVPCFFLKKLMIRLLRTRRSSSLYPYCTHKKESTMPVILDVWFNCRSLSRLYVSVMPSMMRRLEL